MDHVSKTAKFAAKAKARVDRRARSLGPLKKGDRVQVQSDVDGQW